LSGRNGSCVSARPTPGTWTWSEEPELIAPRAVLTSRVVTGATDALAHDETAVSAPARHLRVGWHTLWRAMKTVAAARTSRPGRLEGVRTLGSTSASGDWAATGRTSGWSPRWSTSPATSMGPGFGVTCQRFGVGELRSQHREVADVGAEVRAVLADVGVGARSFELARGRRTRRRDVP
jgi:hypothetical protein